MATKRKAKAEDRTIDLFTGKTVAEALEAEALEAAETRSSAPRDVVLEAEDGAIRWLGLDVFHRGDDVKVAVHKKGHAVLILVSTTRDGVPYGTATLKLSKQQWDKLRSICNQGDK